MAETLVGQIVTIRSKLCQPIVVYLIHRPLPTDTS